MVGILIAVRNFTIAVLLAWMGFSLAPDADDKEESGSIAPNSSAIAFIG
ncbi:MAG: hypothetical protein NXH78_02490 [Hyphomonadaceae bacterium]|nr:hypothetical protein [Hyphomonadaceae bacterium]